MWVLFVYTNCEHPLPENILHDSKTVNFLPVTVKLFSVPLLKCSGLLNRLAQFLRVLEAHV